MTDDEMVNLHVRVEKGKRRKLEAYIPWGFRDKLFRALVDDIIAICEKGNGPEFIAYLISRHIKLTEKGFSVDAQLPNNK